MPVVRFQIDSRGQGRDSFLLRGTLGQQRLLMGFIDTKGTGGQAPGVGLSGSPVSTLPDRRTDLSRWESCRLEGCCPNSV